MFWRGKAMGGASAAILVSERPLTQYSYFHILFIAFSDRTSTQPKLWFCIYIYIYIVTYFVAHNLKILLLTIHQYFIYIFFKASNIQYDQSYLLT